MSTSRITYPTAHGRRWMGFEIHIPIHKGFHLVADIKMLCFPTFVVAEISVQAVAVSPDMPWSGHSRSRETAIVLVIPRFPAWDLFSQLWINWSLRWLCPNFDDVRDFPHPTTTVCRFKVLSFMGETRSTNFEALGDSDTCPTLSDLSIGCAFT